MMIIIIIKHDFILYISIKVKLVYLMFLCVIALYFPAHGEEIFCVVFNGYKIYCYGVMNEFTTIHTVLLIHKTLLYVFVL